MVTVASDGDEALRLLREQRYDVVLADRNLPGMSGLRVIEQAQRLLPHCASVLYTAYPSYETVKEAFEAPAVTLTLDGTAATDGFALLRFTKAPPLAVNVSGTPHTTTESKPTRPPRKMPVPTNTMFVADVGRSA